jgi:hypothetical protein
MKKDPQCGSSWCRLLFQSAGLGGAMQAESWGRGNEGNGVWETLYNMLYGSFSD